MEMEYWQITSFFMLHPTKSWHQKKESAFYMLRNTVFFFFNKHPCLRYTWYLSHAPGTPAPVWTLLSGFLLQQIPFWKPTFKSWCGRSHFRPSFHLYEEVRGRPDTRRPDRASSSSTFSGHHRCFRSTRWAHKSFKFMVLQEINLKINRKSYS